MTVEYKILHSFVFSCHFVLHTNTYKHLIIACGGACADLARRSSVYDILPAFYDNFATVPGDLLIPICNIFAHVHDIFGTVCNGIHYARSCKAVHKYLCSLVNKYLFILAHENSRIKMI